MNYFFSTCLVFIFSFSVLAKEVPALRGPVTDQTGILSPSSASKISSALYQIKKETTNEIAVLIIKSLEDESLEGYSIKVVDKWKLGQKGKDNGILFLISVDDRKMRIEVGSGLQGDLPDAIAGRIIDGVKPYFKSGDYRSGIVFGVLKIADRIGSEIQGLAGPKKVKSRRSKKTLVHFIFVIFFFIISLFGRRRRGYGIYSSGGGFGGGGFSSGGGGSFGGGGGGFSGGGASGGW